MQKWRMYFLVLLFVSLLAYAGYLLILLTSDHEVTLTAVGEKDDLPNKIAVNDVLTTTAAPFKQVTLNNVWVSKAVTYEDVERKTFFTDLEMGFLDNGVKSYFTITLVDRVYYGEYKVLFGVKHYEDRGLVPVNTIPFGEGEYAAVVLAFFPVDSFKDETVIENYCSKELNPLCDHYPALGFGKNPVDGSFVENIANIKSMDLEPSHFAVVSYIRNLVIPKAI